MMIPVREVCRVQPVQSTVGYAATDSPRHLSRSEGPKYGVSELEPNISKGSEKTEHAETTPVMCSVHSDTGTRVFLSKNRVSCILKLKIFEFRNSRLLSSSLKF